MSQVRSGRCLTFVLMGALASACNKEVPLAMVQGECGTAFGGQVCTWAQTRGDSLVEAGADVPIASIEGAPADAQMVWPPVATTKLRLPESLLAQSGLTQLSMFWEAGGHPPAQFLTPHFDFHFYLVPVGEEMSYDCKDLSKPAVLPAAYELPDMELPPDMAKMLGVSTLVGVCVPNMGMHSLPAAEMARKDVFSGDMVIGYYAGKPIFIEPMLTRTMLMERKSFELPIPTIPGLSTAYPRAFRADYDSTAQRYRFRFSGFASGN